MTDFQYQAVYNVLSFALASMIGAVIVYDCTDEHSQQSVMYWVQELQSKGPARCSMAVAANKSDVESKAGDAKAMKAYCDENGLLFVETSAKTGENVGHLFESLAVRVASDLGR